MANLSNPELPPLPSRWAFQVEKTEANLIDPKNILNICNNNVCHQVDLAHLTIKSGPYPYAVFDPLSTTLYLSHQP